MNEASTGFACENSICVLSGVKFLFKENECNWDYGALMESMNVITKLEKESFVRFTHNKIYRISSIFTIRYAHLFVNGSSLSVTNNTFYKSYGIWCKECVTFILSAALLFKENECNNCFYMVIYGITITLEKQTLVSLMQNKIYNASFIFCVGAHLVISESHVVISDNFVADSSTVLWFSNSSLFFSSGKLLIQKMRCENSNLMGTNDTSIIMENRSLVTFVQHDMSYSDLFRYNKTSWNMSFDSELWVRGAYSNDCSIPPMLLSVAQ